MQYSKRNTMSNILSFIIIILLSLTNYLQLLTKIDIYLSFIKITKNILKIYITFYEIVYIHYTILVNKKNCMVIED